MKPPSTAWQRLGAHLLRDPRDLPLLAQLVRGSVLVPLALAVWVAWWRGGGVPLLVACGAHLLAWILLLERFITMFHDVHHSRLFRRPWRVLDHYVQLVYGPLFGSVPYTYFCHHILMHHPTDNGAADLSSTEPYQRDSVGDFLRYFVRFWASTLPVAAFVHRRYTRSGHARRLVLAELGWLALVGLGLWWAPVPTLVVVVVPTVCTRSMLILGNWGEHAFVDPQDPGNLWRNSLDLHGPLNDRCYNVGYHIGHHIRPGAHFSSQPGWFRANAQTFGEQDAIVLQGLHYPQVCLWLLLKRYDALAARFVQLPGAPVRGHDEVVALLRSRVAAIPVAEATP